MKLGTLLGMRISIPHASEIHVSALLAWVMAGSSCVGDPWQMRGDPAENEREADSSLPDTLTGDELKARLVPLESRARECAEAHGAESGTTVSVELRIYGATGAVFEASPRPPFANTELGRCVADALAQARFPRFKHPSLGVAYAVVL